VNVAIQLKQISLPSGTSTTAVTDGQVLTGTEAAELIAGLDASTNTAQFIATDPSGAVLVADGGASLTVDSEQLPAALSNGRLNTNLGSWIGSTAPTIGQKAMGASLPVVLASDQSPLTVQGDPTGEPLRISIPSVSDAGNSSTAILAGSAVFTGTPVFVRDYASMGVQVFASHGSASDGLRFEWSQNGTNWDEVLAFTIFGNAAASYVIGPRSDWFRVVYRNGSNAQTAFRLQTNLHYSLVRTGTVRISDSISSESDCVLSKNVITGRSTAGGTSFVDVKVNPSGSVSISGDVSVNNFPTGAATEATLATRLTEATFTTRTPTVGQKTAAASSPVVLASDQPALPIADGGGSLTVDGAVTADIGSPGPLALDATLTGGSQKTQIRGVEKGDTPAGDVTSTNVAFNRQLLDVAIYDASGTQVTSFGGGSSGGGVQYDDGDARGTATGTLMMIDDGTGQIRSASGNIEGRLNVNADIADPITISTASGLALDSTMVNGQVLVQIWDGGINPIVIKDAGTPADGTEAALVVALSPNNTVGVSAASLPLPTGAATAAKQPALGTAGTPSADVITVQGATTGTALKVDGSAVTQPVSGTVTATVRGGAKGSTTAADLTSSASGANHQALDVIIYDTAGNPITSFGGSAGNTTAALSNVAASITSVTLLASNTGRKGGTIWNDSTALLYVKLGSTAAATSCTIKMAADSYYEIPFNYSGIITGIWASATGSARVTEVTA